MSSEVKKKGFTHDNVQNVSIEWYTPPWVFEKLGLIFDLDPCHPEIRINWIPASKTYSIRDDGLKQDWQGRVFLNPLYGKETPLWLERMHQHRNGIALVFARTDCVWFHNFVAKADAILFLKGRVKFVDGLGVTKGSGAGSGSMLIAWGSDNVQALINIADMGFLTLPNKL